MPNLDPKSIPLAYENLRSDSISQINKDDFISAFVESQKTFLATYATEGRASWDMELSGTTHLPPSTDEDPDIVSFGFNTPILKPRVHKGHAQQSGQSNKNVTTAKRTRRDSEIAQTPNKNISLLNGECSPKVSETAKRGQKKRPTKGVKAVQKTLNDFTAIKSQPPKSTKAAGTKRMRSPSDTDEERSARMAERRERRRKKRTIVQPKADHNNEERVDKHPGKKRGEKTKGFAAGLALMHGFSAKNIGKQRLTLPPDQNIGVFSKGKASAKVAVESASKKRTGLIHFSETKFLGNIRCSAPHASDSEGPSTRCSSPSGELKEPPKRCQKNKHRSEISNAPSSQGNEETRLKRNGYSAGGSTVDESVSNSGADREAKQKKLSESIVWDIECNTISPSIRSGVSLPQEPDQQEGSMILDTRGLPWGDPQSMELPPEATRSDHAVTRDDCRLEEKPYIQEGFAGRSRDGASSASLGPWQSASQIGKLTPEAVHEPLVSKYFDLPISTRIPASGISNLQDESLIQPDRLQGDQTEDFICGSRNPTSTTEVQRKMKHDIMNGISSDASLSDHTAFSSMSIDSLERELLALGTCRTPIGSPRVFRGENPATEEIMSNLDGLYVQDPLMAKPDSQSGVDGQFDYSHRQFQGVLHSEFAETCMDDLDDDTRYVTQPEVYDAQDVDHACAPYHQRLRPEELPYEYEQSDNFDDFQYVQTSTLAPTGVLEFDSMVNNDYSGKCIVLDREFDGQADLTISDNDFDTGYQVEGSYLDPGCCGASPWRLRSDRERSMSPSDLSTVPEANFSQGRALLLGLHDRDMANTPSEYHCMLSKMEIDVAKSLKGHWLPQRA
ncbi:uncharacterized protein FIBRA_03773 [Fibroporia radiculosa]|uniref:Uncharacterized protein n=1 Tax=Fibroporia radiculosa TaxID=599839 RepID=J4G6A9_9APHY|nr:uncharacterized protein FIBRA_03773 [Fibroporia radiculosa]CCM01708.1 predicted protein [Fibroporia radiculosa]